MVLTSVNHSYNLEQNVKGKGIHGGPPHKDCWLWLEIRCQAESFSHPKELLLISIYNI